MKNKVVLIIFLIVAILAIMMLLPNFKSVEDDIEDIPICASNTLETNRNADVSVPNIAPKDTPIESMLDILHSNKTAAITVTNAIGESMRICMDSDSAQYVEYAEIAFANVKQHVNMPDGVEAVVKIEDDYAIVTFPIPFDGVLREAGHHAKVRIDIQTKSVRKPVQIGWYFYMD